MKSSSSLRAHHLKKQEVHIRHRFSQDRRCGSHKLWDVGECGEHGTVFTWGLFSAAIKCISWDVGCGSFRHKCAMQRKILWVPQETCWKSALYSRLEPKGSGQVPADRGSLWGVLANLLPSSPRAGEASARLSCVLPPRLQTFLPWRLNEQDPPLLARCGRALCKTHVLVLPNPFQRLANIYAALEGRKERRFQRSGAAFCLRPLHLPAHLGGKAAQIWDYHPCLFSSASSLLMLPNGLEDFFVPLYI